MSQGLSLAFKNWAADTFRGPIKAYNRICAKALFRGRTIQAKPLDFSALENKKILVLAPHIDDEVLGIGGFFLAMRNKAETDLLYTTNSMAGVGGAVRYKELEQVAARLSLHVLGAVDIPNTFQENVIVPRKAELVAAICEALEKKEYALVATVNFLDAHIDHETSAFALAEALEQVSFTKQQAPQILLYQGSNFLPYGWINRYRQLSVEERKAKSDLLACYQSQVCFDFDLYDMLGELQTRAYLHRNEGGEFYRLSSAREFIQLAHALDPQDIQQNYQHRFSAHHSFHKTIDGERNRQERYTEILRSVL